MSQVRGAMPPRYARQPRREKPRAACAVTGAACGRRVDSTLVTTPELRQLRAFVAVAEARQPHRRGRPAAHRPAVALPADARAGGAARRRPPRAQPRAASRSPRRARCSCARRAPVLAQADRAAEAVRRAARGEVGHLRVGFLPSVANYVMPPVVRAFRERHPEIALETQDLPVARLVAGLREGRSTPASPGRRRSTTSRRSACCASRSPPSSPRATRSPAAPTLRLADLAGEPWVLTPRDSWPPWHRKYDEDFARAGFTARVVQRGEHAAEPARARRRRRRRHPAAASPRRACAAAASSSSRSRARRPRSCWPGAPGAANPALTALRAVVRDVAPAIDPEAAG